MGFRIISEMVTFFLGLDLGQMRSPTALALVERAQVYKGRDMVTYESIWDLRFRVRHLERVALGTPYPSVVDRVRDLVRRPELAGRCTLVMDATGVGAPVLDLLRGARLGCPIVPVIMTGGEKESRVGGLWHVPKRDLICGLQVMLERRELGFPASLPASRELAKELADVESRMTWAGGRVYGAMGEGQHDDLVIATALACWRARRKEQPFFGTRSLGLE